MLVQGVNGNYNRGGDGNTASLRLGRNNELVIAGLNGWFTEQTMRGNVYTLRQLTTTNIAAGNQTGAAAAASTQFALWNPVGNTKYLVLNRFILGVVSGTMPSGPVYHGILTTAPTLSASVGGPANNNLVGGGLPSARYVTHVTGSVLTGGAAPVTFRAMPINFTAAAYASAMGSLFNDNIDGDIILPPGTGWVPLFGGAGTSVLYDPSITWSEIDI